MKKSYEKPVAEKYAFDYRNQVVASGGTNDKGSGTDCQPAGCSWKRDLGTGACEIVWLSPQPF